MVNWFRVTAGVMRDTQVKGRGFSVGAPFQQQKQTFPFFDPCGLSAGAACYPTITVCMQNFRSFGTIHFENQRFLVYINNKERNIVKLIFCSEKHYSKKLVISFL